MGAVIKILYHIPSLYTIYAHRTIYNGFKNAFINLGHQFRPLTSDDNFDEVIKSYRPDLFITSSFFWHRKFINYNNLLKYREQGLFCLTKLEYWNSPFTASRINEAASLKTDAEARKLLDLNLLGDAFFQNVEQGDLRMDGFEKATGKSFHTIPLAADSIILSPNFDVKFKAEISFIGTNLPERRHFFKENVFPLRNKLDIKIYGQDWSIFDKYMGWIQRAGQFLNVPIVRSFRKPKLALVDEAKIYTSSSISINIHEQYQKVFGGDCNERTFKIPLCGGFQIVDNVNCISKYFSPGTDIVTFENATDWKEKIFHYLHHPEDRNRIALAGRKNVLLNHTYLNRAQQIISLIPNK